MTKIQKHIEIVRSSIPALSSMSLKSATAILDVLKQHYQVVGITTVNSPRDLEKLIANRPDLVFMGMKYVPSLEVGKKTWISGQLTKHGITHTGSPERAIKYEQNKPFAKQCLMDAGFQTSPYLVVKDPETLVNTDISLRFPLFVKPTCLGAGQGVDEYSIVHNSSELYKKVVSIIETFHVDALIEEYLPGCEFSVAILKKRNDNTLLAMPIEMHPGADINGDHILSNALKAGELETPVSIVAEGALKEQLKALAIGVFTTIGARDYGRIDIKLDALGVPNFLEANLIPSIINNSGNFQKSTRMNMGITYEDMLLHIVNLAFDRVPKLSAEESSEAIAASLDHSSTMQTR